MKIVESYQNYFWEKMNMQFDFDKLLLQFATSMVGLIPVLINLTVNWAERKSKIARISITIAI